VAAAAARHATSVIAALPSRTLASHMRLRVATFNIRNVNDRYDERRSLLGAAFAALGADVIGLQEVGFREGKRQDDFLAAWARRERGREYLSLESRGRNPEFGNAIMFATGEVLAHEQLRFDDGRTAQRALFALPGQRTVWFANTHLHHVPGEPELREAQVERLVTWMGDAPDADATLVVGDFNAPPHEPAYQRMQSAGFRSASLEANGAEPGVTWPSGIQAPTMDTDGDPNCLDYIWLSGRVRVLSASVAANLPAENDPTLYPSDHFALIADIEL
jgi:endonuclease/exonuclease/phosphatase family metal-dependent hydrolase